MKWLEVFFRTFFLLNSGSSNDDASSSSVSCPPTANGAAFNRSRPFTVHVEGNVGCGKSTMLEFFRDELHLSPQVDLVFEPVHEWQNVAGENLFGMMLANSTRWGMAFQLYSSLTR